MCHDGNRPVMDVQVCVNCGKCVNECPGGLDVWYIFGVQWLPDIAKCCETSCDGECWDVCPVCALGTHPC